MINWLIKASKCINYQQKKTKTKNSNEPKITKAWGFRVFSIFFTFTGHIHSKSFQNHLKPKLYFNKNDKKILKSTEKSKHETKNSTDKKILEAIMNRKMEKEFITTKRKIDQKYLTVFMIILL